jgi:hypothetical protein
MHQLPEFMAQATHTKLYIAVWLLSIILQAALFSALFSRRIAGRAPFFTNLVGFYLFRSIVCFVLLNPLSVAAYSRLYHLFLLVEILVQVCVAAAFTDHVVRIHGGWRTAWLAVPIVLLCAAIYGTHLTTEFEPGTHAPLDRSLIAFSFYMILLCAWTFFSRNLPEIIRIITQGFALYGLINIAADIGRTIAFHNDDLRSYAAWTYALAASYLASVVFWFVTLKSPPATINPTNPSSVPVKV